MKLSEDKQEFFAATFSEFINHFFSQGAPSNAIKKILSKMVDAVEEDRKSLT